MACFDEQTALELLSARRASILRSALEIHVEQCARCRALVAELAGGVAWSPASHELAPGARAGPYRVERAVTSGAAGTVYRAVDERTGALVALKHLTDRALRSRFERERETLARLHHPAIVRSLGHGEAAGGLYLAMEWLEGETLAEALRDGPLGWKAARALGIRLAGALAHAHHLGCVHRDLSPRNVFLVDGRLDQAKLLDFGLARVDDGHETNTTPEAMLGTAYYMAPEQVRNAKDVDGRADLFGLGVLLYETVAGEPPFVGEDRVTVWLRIVDQPTPDLRARAVDVPEAFVLLVEGLLAKDRRQRPARAEDVREALEALEEG